MNHHHDHGRCEHEGWGHVGRAAEDFARRVARDASRFAERLQEHTSDFAHDMTREWRRARRHARSSSFRPDVAPEDVRRVFDDVRGLVVDVLGEIDEFISTVFPSGDAQRERTDEAEPSAPAWEKLVSNRDVACSACGARIAVGDEAFVCRGAEGVAYRCATCGAASDQGARG